MINIAIVGGGKLGVKVCESLLSGNYNITLIDKNENILSKLSHQLDVMPIVADGKDVNLLKEIGIKNYDYLLASTGSDETNMVIASFAKKMGCKTVIARIREPEYMKHFAFIKEAMDIDYIVNPDFAITMEIYKYLAEKYTLSNGMFTTDKIGLIEFKAEKLKEIVGLSLREVKQVLPDLIIGALSKNGKVIIPHGEDIIKAEDFVYVVGEKEKIIELNKKVHERGKYTNLQKVMIVGGGKTGYYLAEKLAEFGASVKLIEKKKERCQYLSTHMKNVMVLHGDGTDISMLVEENLEQMDAFVTATGYDEENLLLALSAKNKGIEDVISKVSRESYTDLIEKMGVDMVLNPLDITAGNIFGIIQEEKRIISSVLIQGQAEIVEIIASEKMEFVNQCLSNLKMPKGILITAIHRGDKVIIPDGNTKILINDRVLIFSLLTGIKDLEALLKNR